MIERAGLPPAGERPEWLTVAEIKEKYGFDRCAASEPV